ncbi:hypothetical protein B4U80_08322, partial [Leptotrombidium deliense]
ESLRNELVATVDDVKQTVMVVLVISCRQNIDRRNAIRETWVKLGNHEQFKYYFVIGSLQMSEEHLNSLKAENETHQDLLLLSNVKDNYSSLTHKVLAAFQWIQRCVQFQYVLKVDDDSFVRIDAVLNELLERKKVRTKLFWGYFDGRASVKRKGQWKEDHWFLCDRYLPYAIGGGYVLSSDLVRFIAENGDSFQMYTSEDVSVGVWLSPLKVDRVHDPRFDTEFESRGCSNRYLITHKQSVREFHKKYQNLINFGKLCDTEYVYRNAYQYNWRVPASQCCVRNLSLITT